MIKEIEHAIAAFLGTLPEQVRMWDAELVHRLMQHPTEFAAFQAGNDLTKWQIYMSARLRAQQTT